MWGHIAETTLGLQVKGFVILQSRLCSSQFVRLREIKTNLRDGINGKQAFFHKFYEFHIEQAILHSTFGIDNEQME